MGGSPTGPLFHLSARPWFSRQRSRNPRWEDAPLRRRSPLDYLDRFVTRTAEAGVLQCAAEDDVLNGRTVRIRGREHVHFGSCSYLGLELDPRMKQAVCEAADRFGTQFSSSRSYLSSPLYAAVEERLGEILGGPALVTPSTTLGHLSAIPALVERDDAVLMDHQVHHSVQTAVQVARREGCHVELVRHGAQDELEARAIELAPRHRRVWVLADGVYSMFGDLAPVDALWALAERIPNLWLYVDDAHGMGWCGPRGCGSVLSRVPLTPRVIVATSLNKSFAAAGGCLVFGDEEVRRRVFTVGGPMIFAGPVQPPMLGAALASAEIHLSDELPGLQQELQARIESCTDAILARGLPLVSSGPTPIRFVGVGLPRVARNLARRLLDDGWFVNVSHFPAVPMKQAGIRFTVTRHLQREDFEGLADAMARHYEPAFREEGQSSEAVWRTFGLPTPVAPSRLARPREVEEFDRIDAIDRDEWDQMLGARGTFSWNGLRFLEQSFDDPSHPEQDWRFRYYIVRDEQGRPVVASFFSCASWKLDMLEDAAVSREVEARRAKDPGYLVAPVFSMGSLLTEGDHLYVDPVRLPPGSPAWEKALGALLTAARDRAEAESAEWLVLRDLEDDPILEAFLDTQGFVRRDGPERLEARVAESEAAQLAMLTSAHRRFQRREVGPWNETYEVQAVDGRSPGAADLSWGHLAALYGQVKQSSLELNTFALPPSFFERALGFPEWELLLLREKGQPESPPLAVIAAFRAPGRYCPMVIGMDQAHARARGLYRQALRATFARARQLGAQRLQLGLGATLQKRRFGARAFATNVYLQAEDHYALDVMAQIKAELGVGTG